MSVLLSVCLWLSIKLRQFSNINAYIQQIFCNLYLNNDQVLNSKITDYMTHTWAHIYIKSLCILYTKNNAVYNSKVVTWGQRHQKRNFWCARLGIYDSGVKTPEMPFIKYYWILVWNKCRAGDLVSFTDSLFFLKFDSYNM